MIIRRGQLYWIDLGHPRGSSPGYERPAVVIQDDTLNSTNIRTVVIAVVTTNLRLAEIDGNVLLMPKPNGVQQASVVNLTQLYTIDKTDLINPIGKVSRSEMKQIDNGLRLVLSLTSWSE